jgi:hypothetical protein
VGGEPKPEHVKGEMPRPDVGGVIRMHESACHDFFTPQHSTSSVSRLGGRHNRVRELGVVTDLIVSTVPTCLSGASIIGAKSGPLPIFVRDWKGATVVLVFVPLHSGDGVHISGRLVGLCVRLTLCSLRWLSKSCRSCWTGAKIDSVVRIPAGTVYPVCCPAPHTDFFAGIQ